MNHFLLFLTPTLAQVCKAPNPQAADATPIQYRVSVQYTGAGLPLSTAGAFDPPPFVQAELLRRFGELSAIPGGTVYGVIADLGWVEVKEPKPENGAPDDGGPVVQG